MKGWESVRKKNGSFETWLITALNKSVWNGNLVFHGSFDIFFIDKPMSWTQWFEISLYQGNTAHEGQHIGLSAEFRTNWINIPGICRFHSGLVGGTFNLMPDSGYVPASPRWANQSIRHIDDPTRGYYVRINDSINRPQWHVGYRMDWPMTHYNSCIEGLLDQSSFANLIDFMSPCSVKVTYNVDRHHIYIPKVDWKPLIKCHRGATEVSDKKHVVLTALLRHSLHQQLGSTCGTDSLTLLEAQKK